MPTFITLIVPDDKVDEVLVALPAPCAHTSTTLPEKKFASADLKAWATRYGLPAAAAVIAQWQHIMKSRKDVH